MTPNESLLSEWHLTPLGTLLANHERHVVSQALEDVFGLQLLQIGAWGEHGQLIAAARTQRKAVIGLSTRGNAQICSKASELAVASDSVDAVLLPHTLEFEMDPYAVLREVQRVLIGEGRLLVLGFNPIGPWATRHRFSAEGFPPGMARLISERRLREWLTLLGFEVAPAHRYLRRFPWSPKSLVSHESIVDGVAHSRWSLFSSAYLLTARKRVYMLTPILPRWRERPAIVGGVSVEGSVGFVRRRLYVIHRSPDRHDPSTDTA
jgi:SAM-dependent methyltransferase